VKVWQDTRNDYIPVALNHSEEVASGIQYLSLYTKRYSLNLSVRRERESERADENRMRNAKPSYSSSN